MSILAENVKTIYEKIAAAAKKKRQKPRRHYSCCGNKNSFGGQNKRSYPRGAYGYR